MTIVRRQSPEKSIENSAKNLGLFHRITSQPFQQIVYQHEDAEIAGESARMYIDQSKVNAERLQLTTRKFGMRSAQPSNGAIDVTGCYKQIRASDKI
jgi:hypothetical protein